MKYLLLTLLLITPIVNSQGLPVFYEQPNTQVEPLPEHMVFSSMKDLHNKTGFIIDVTVENSQDGWDLEYWAFGTEEPFTESYILHQVTLNKIIEDTNDDESWQEGLTDADKFYNSNPEVGDRFFVRQWGNLEGKHYEGVPLLIPGNEYRLYLDNTFFTEDTTGAKIYYVVGQNGGIFRKEGTRVFRDNGNTSKLIN